MSESLRERVYRLVRNDPSMTLKTLMKQFSEDQYNSVKTYRWEQLQKITPGITKSKKKKVIKKSKLYTGPGVKDKFHEQSEWIVDKDLEHFEGIELIKHFTEKAIKNKLLDMTNRLRAMTLYVQFYDKAGKIKGIGEMEDQEAMIELKKIPLIERIELLKTASGDTKRLLEKANKTATLEEQLGVYD